MGSTTIIEHADATAIEQEAAAVVARANAIEIATQQDCEAAGVFLRQVKTVLNNIAETFDKPVKAAHTAHKEMIAARDNHAKPLKVAERAVKAKIGTWTAEQDRIRRDQEARLAKLAQEAEEARRMEEAERLEAENKPEEAEAVIDAPVVVPAPVLPPPPKMQGVSTRENWKFRIVSINALPREYLMPDMARIGSVVRSLKGQANIPGVRVYAESVVAAARY